MDQHPSLRMGRRRRRARLRQADIDILDPLSFGIDSCYIILSHHYHPIGTLDELHAFVIVRDKLVLITAKATRQAH